MWDVFTRGFYLKIYLGSKTLREGTLGCFTEASMKYVFILLALAAETLLISKDQTPQIKAFIVYDGTECLLERCYRKDGYRMEKILKEMAALTKLRSHIQIEKSSHLSRAKLLSWAHKLSTKDIAVFYYAGNPFYNTCDQWPSLHLSDSQPPISQEQLTKCMKHKKPRLGVVLFDCYNRIIPCKRLFWSKAPPHKERLKTRLSLLFLKSSGVLSACSSRSTERGFAICHSGVMGGIFTLGIQAYLESCYHKTANWDGLIATVENICTTMSEEKQHLMLYKDIKKPSRPHLRTRGKSMKAPATYGESSEELIWTNLIQ